LLRDISDGADIVRKCVEVVKAAASGMDWDIIPLPTAVDRILAESPEIGTAQAAKAAREMLMPDIARVKDVELFKFSSTSKQQIMEGLAVKIQQRAVTFPEGHIADELSNFEYEYTKNGVKYSAPQGLHDDCVCALALAVHKFKNASTSGRYSII
jgi:hypothetical protein